MFVSMLFDQLLPDFAVGNLLVISDMTAAFIQSTLAKMLCYAHVATAPKPSLEELIVNYRKYLPASVVGLVTETQWASSVSVWWGVDRTGYEGIVVAA